MKDYAGGLPKMTPRLLSSLLAFLPLTLAAQPVQERAIPLSNWTAPRHLKRSQLYTQQRVATPKLQLPGGVTTDVLVFVPITPCRLADTRPSQPYPALGTTPLAPLTPRTLTIAGSCGVESTGFLFPGPEAFSLNVTAVPPSGNTGGYLLVYPNPITPIPLVASLTWNPGASFQSNAVISAASSNGSVNVVANATTDVVIDINGYYAAPSDDKGDTALGTYALNSDTSGTDNTAFGYAALGLNTSGADNTAFGVQALGANTNGTGNTAVGYDAMESTNGANTSGAGLSNTAVGSQALEANVLGTGNTALGALAMQNGSGDYNTAIGYQAGAAPTGGNNVLIGFQAGFNASTGSYNIIIGNYGVSGDDKTIKIGAQGTQTSTYIAGILGNSLSSASPVVINSTGQLGVEGVSSRRYKEDIQDMGDASKGLLRLRPVTFHYKKSDSDESKPLEYGLIAEEVADVYPELVIRGSDGQIESVQYQKLPAMLLNELQKQGETIRKLEARLAGLEAEMGRTPARADSHKVAPSSVGGR
jgi:hypothetical protein